MDAAEGKAAGEGQAAGSGPAPGELLAALRPRAGALAADLEALVGAESPSADEAALRACAGVVAELGTRLLGAEPEWLEGAGRPNLRWRFGPAPGAGDGRPRVVLLAHFDTVWPVGTAASWPARRDGDRFTGPGAYDCKGGLVQAMHALAALRELGAGLDGVELLCNGDEEIGSPGSEPLITEASRGAAAVLVVEPSAGAGGALKIARKGAAHFELAVTGRAAHAGLQPELGVNATVELAHLVLAVERLARPDLGTTVTPTVAAAGTTGNTVPASGRLHVDVRTLEPAELERVAGDLAALRPVLPGASLAVTAGPARPPLPASATADLLALARPLAEALGLGHLDAIAVGGGSDGNLAAAAGAPVLDGLGAVGDHIHAEGEYAVLSAMPERAALVAALVQACRSGDGGGPDRRGAASAGV